jgi:hypothetical protein
MACQRRVAHSATRQRTISTTRGRPAPASRHHSELPPRLAGQGFCRQRTDASSHDLEVPGPDRSDVRLLADLAST